MVRKDFQKEWRSSEIAKVFKIGESTLRKKLLNEDTSISDLITDTKLSYALNMIQSTNRPIQSIASEIGYTSSSKFAIRFKERFGVSPKDFRKQN